MGQPVFPRAREDGSIVVAACFQLADVAESAAVRDYLRTWLTAADAGVRSNMAKELASEPKLVDVEDLVVGVAFEARPGSRFWKDVLVRFTADANDATSLSFKGFFDLVAERYHAGSLRE